AAPAGKRAAGSVLADCGRCKTLQSLEAEARHRVASRLDEPRMPIPFETTATAAIPITFVTKSSWEAIRAGLAPAARQFAESNGFAGKPGACLTLPGADGTVAQVLFGLEEAEAGSRDPFRPGALPGLLPAGTYRFANAPHDPRLAALAFALGSYR